MNIKKENRDKWSYLLVALISVLCVYVMFRYLLPLVFPFVLAFIIAVCIRPIMFLLNRRLRIPNGIGAGIALVLFLSVIILFLCILIYQLSLQVSRLVELLPVLQDNLMLKLYDLCDGCDHMLGFRDGTVVRFFNFHEWDLAGYLKNQLLPILPVQTLQLFLWGMGAFAAVFIVIVAAILLAKDYEDYKKILTSSVFFQDVRRITDKLTNAGLAYLKAQLIIITLIAIICVLGLMIIRNDYALIIGILIAVLDAFPILGSGFVLIPWAIVMLLRGNIVSAAVLFTIYLCCLLVRQFLEPKLIGDKIGIRPVFTLLAIYIGIQIYGGIGFILGPISLVMIKTILESFREKTGLSNGLNKE